MAFKSRLGAKGEEKIESAWKERVTGECLTNLNQSQTIKAEVDGK